MQEDLKLTWKDKQNNKTRQKKTKRQNQHKMNQNTKTTNQTKKQKQHKTKQRRNYSVLLYGPIQPVVGHNIFRLPILR